MQAYATLFLPYSARAGRRGRLLPGGCGWLLALALLGAWRVAGAQAPAWQTQLLTAHTDQESSRLAVAADERGNVFVAGSFNGSLTLGNLALRLGSPNVSELFVAKWEAATQRFGWVQPLAISRAGGKLTMAAANGRVYIGCGDMLHSVGDLGSVGVYLWTQVVPSAITALATRDGAVYVAGTFRYPFTAGGTTTISAGKTDVFVAKYADSSSSADLRWVQTAGGAEEDEATALAVSGPNVYVAGNFSSPGAYFGPALYWNGHSDENGPDGVVAKLTDAGTSASFGWVLAASSADYDYLPALAVQGNHVYVAANMTSYGYPGRVKTFGPVQLPYHDRSMLLVARVTDEGPAGRVDWVTTTEEGNEATGLAARGSSLYLMGIGGNPGSVGGYPISHPVNPQSYSLTHPSFFLAKLTDVGTAGIYTWAQTNGEDTAAWDGAMAVGGPAPGVYATGITYADTRKNTVGQSFFAGLLDTAATIPDYAASLTHLSLFPNPAHATATLWLPPLPLTTAVSIRWYGALGQLVRTQTVPPGESGTALPLPLDGLAAGAYYLRIEAGDQRATCKLIVE